MFVCGFCKKTISNYSTLYFGFDCMCCSNHCRSQVIELILKIDPIMNSPEKWSINTIQKTKPDTLYNILKELKL